MNHDADQAKQAAPILDRLQAGESLTTEEVVRHRSDPAILPALLRAVKDRPPQVRRAALPLLVDLGRPVQKAHGDVPELLAPYLDEPSVVAHLVGALGDEDMGVRNTAALALAAEVPEPALRDHSREVIEAIRKYPGTDGAALLLGRIGAEAGRRLILSTPKLRDASPADTRVALGRLGDHGAESELIKAYQEAKDPEDKAKDALRLGHLGTPRAVLALARDMRTPEAYVWRMNSRRSMRVHLIEALHVAFLTEPAFWRPFYKPEDDSYYDGVERWLTANLGVTWSRPRPEFLYEEDAPIMPRQ